MGIILITHIFNAYFPGQTQNEKSPGYAFITGLGVFPFSEGSILGAFVRGAFFRTVVETAVGGLHSAVFGLTR